MNWWTYIMFLIIEGVIRRILRYRGWYRFMHGKDVCPVMTTCMQEPLPTRTKWVSSLLRSIFSIPAFVCTLLVAPMSMNHLFVLETSFKDLVLKNSRKASELPFFGPRPWVCYCVWVRSKPTIWVDEVSLSKSLWWVE